MLSEEEFTKRYTERLAEVCSTREEDGKYKVEKWMTDIAPDAYEMWVDDDPEVMTPEEMADEEIDAMRSNG